MTKFITIDEAVQRKLFPIPLGEEELLTLKNIRTLLWLYKEQYPEPERIGRRISELDAIIMRVISAMEK